MISNNTPSTKNYLISDTTFRQTKTHRLGIKGERENQYEPSRHLHNQFHTTTNLKVERTPQVSASMQIILTIQH